MSGVQTGTRAERLQRLLDRARLELASARRRDDRREAARIAALVARAEAALDAEQRRARDQASTAAPAAGPEHGGSSVELRALAELGVTARDVKVWAVGAGLLDAVRRGRVKHDLVLAYAEAHRQETSTR